MTYNDYFKQLQKEYAEASDKFLKKDKELSEVSGFSDIKDLTEYSLLKQNWQIAHDNYYFFINFVRKNNISPDSKMGL